MTTIDGSGVRAPALCIDTGVGARLAAPLRLPPGLSAADRPSPTAGL